MIEASQKKKSWKPLITIIFSMVMMYVTSFGINVIIGAIVKDLQTTVANVQFVIVSASLVAGSLMVTAGKLGDKFGRKKIFVLGVAIYTIGLITVVLSPNIAIFTVAWGLIWPSGMVLVIPTSIALIIYFYEGDQRAAAFGIYGAVLAGISALAPVIVGYLANTVGWRVALSISPAAGVLTFLLALSLPETDKDDSVKIDLLSVFLSVAGFGLFLITTTAAGQYGWFWEKRPFMVGDSPLHIGGLSIVPVAYLISFVLLGAFVWRGIKLKKAGQSPLLGVEILKNSTFTLGMLIGAILFLVTAGALFSLSVFLQAGVRFDSLQTALTLLPYSAAYAVVSFATPNLGKKIAPKWIIVAGSAMTMVFLWLIGERVATDMKPTDILPYMIALGIGMGLIMAQITTVTMSRVAAEESGEASGLSETLKEILGQGFAVALAGSVLFGAVYASMADSFSKIEGEDMTSEERQEIVIELENVFQEISEEDEKEWVSKLPEKTRESYGEIVKTAAEKGLSTALLVMNICMALGLLLALALPGGKMAEEEA
jgi:MFS family permease